MEQNGSEKIYDMVKEMYKSCFALSTFVIDENQNQYAIEQGFWAVVNALKCVANPKMSETEKIIELENFHKSLNHALELCKQAGAQ